MYLVLFQSHQSLSGCYKTEFFTCPAHVPLQSLKLAAYLAVAERVSVNLHLLKSRKINYYIGEQLVDRCCCVNSPMLQSRVCSVYSKIHLAISKVGLWRSMLNSLSWYNTTKEIFRICSNCQHFLLCWSTPYTLNTMLAKCQIMQKSLNLLLISVHILTRSNARAPTHCKILAYHQVVVEDATRASPVILV